jgi:chorismate mutase/prephenate dehydratase
MDGESLTGLRAEIDRIDAEIVDLLERRAAAAVEIGRVKRSSGASLLDPARETTLMGERLSTADGPLSNEALGKIFTEIISACRALQGPTRIAYLGPEGTFTHLAGLERFGRSCDFVSGVTIEEVFDHVERDRANFGVVPIENSNEGAVGVTLDRLAKSELKITGEIYRPVSHVLMSRETDIDSVETVFSHPQAIAQCRGWLGAHMPSRAAAPTESTAAAAARAAEESRTAALGNEALAERHGLNILARNIQDGSPNLTRFIVLGKEDCAPTGNDKTSIVFSTAHRPGALFHALARPANHGINLTRIESRPSKESPWDYIFFTDLEGHRADEPVGKVLEELESSVKKLKVLGSYPSGRRKGD